jgi:GH35 family endo-1,4-beta-xylanase
MAEIYKDVHSTRFHRFAVPVGASAPRTNDVRRVRVPRVRVRQVSHAFLFGSNLFGLMSGPEDPERVEYRRAAQRLWNAGTLPFYWGSYEPEEADVPAREGAAMAAARWMREHNMTPKGHPLAWHTNSAKWLLTYDEPTMLRKQIERIQREVRRFAGIIDMWDVINELVIMPRFDKYDNPLTRLARSYGEVNLALELFRAARDANPAATLLINDFMLTNEYERLIAQLLDRGCPIDAIGLQTHQHHGYRGPEATARVLERFAGFGLPLHFTENTLLSGEPIPGHIWDPNDYRPSSWPSTPEAEERQRDQVAEFYTQVFAHPSVAAVIWWDLADGAWLNAPAGLLREDFSPKPAFRRLEELILGEWWLEAQELPVDADGMVRFEGTAGRYAIAEIGEGDPPSKRPPSGEPTAQAAEPDERLVTLTPADAVE